MTASEASRRATAAGTPVSISGVRHWASSGAVATRQRDGRALVSVEDVLEKAAARPARAWTTGPKALPLDERRERVVEMYADGLTTYAIAVELDCSQATIAKDVKALGISRVGAPPRKYPEPETRECAREGCARTFTPKASDVARGNGRYCSRSCAVRAEPSRPRLAGQWRRCRRPKCENRVWFWDAHERRGDGHAAAGYCSAECAGKHRWVRDEGASVKGLEESLRERGLWSGSATKRHAGRRHGHRGASYGIDAKYLDRPTGGRPVKYTKEQEAAVIERLSRGRSIRDTALYVFGEVGARGMVAGIKKRAGL